MTSITNNGEDFDFVVNGSIQKLSVKELTILERTRVAKSLEEKIKEVARKEALEISKMLPEKERNKYLCEVAKNNSKISEEEINAAAESVFGLVEVLKAATKKTELDWEQIYLDNTEMCGRAYFFALYGQVETTTETSPKKEEEQAEKFCETSAIF